MARGGYRPGSGPKKGTKYKTRSSKPQKTTPKKKPKDIPVDIQEDAEREELTPLEYMLKVMNTETADPNRRDRMAQAAAPFVHRRAEGKVGKKEVAADQAKSVTGGKFSPGQAPKIVNIGKK